jgi:L-alanine-DL-glutamate epimerase-like enolase superfamily enzyme
MNEPHRIKVNVARERWPLAAAFSISRGSKTEAEVVVVDLSDGRYRGRGECVPYGRYGETVEGVVAAVEASAPALMQGLDRARLQQAMPAGAARNALDCALWDLEAKRGGTSAAALAGIASLRPVTTAYTISLDTPAAMAQAAARATHRPLLKVKLGAGDDAARIAAVRRAAPTAELIVDANEGWHAGDLDGNFAACVAAGVTMIEQPLPAADDAALATIAHPVAICADESVHGQDSLGALVGKYEMVNIKLDKTGGLTAALALADAARRMGFEVMVGSMVGTSLAVAPAMLLAQRARIVDLDGPLLLAQDRPDGLRVEGSLLYPPTARLWG